MSVPSSRYDLTASRSALALRPEDTLRLALLFAPATLLLVFGRMAEYAGVGGGGAKLSTVLWTDLPVPALLLTCSVLTWMFVRRAVSTNATLLATGAALGVGAGGAVLCRLALPWWVTEWLTPEAVSFLKADLLIVMGALMGLAVVFAAVGHTRAGRGVGVFLAHATAAAIVMVVVTDMAVLLGTGARGGYFALRDFLHDPIHLAPVVMSEMTAGSVMLLCLPLAVACAPLVVVRRVEWKGGGSRVVPIHRVLAACGLLLVTTAAAPVEESGAPVQGALVRMATMTWEDLQWEENGMAEMRPDGNPFDLRGAELVATDSTRALNVVVLVLESVRRSAVTSYAPDLPTTPFLDSLARDGLVIEEMYTPVPYTNKALVSIFGGVPPSPDSRIVEALPGGIPSPGLPGLLREHGYRSAFFTPATLAFERKDLILENMGFDEAYGDGSFERDGFEKKAYFGYEDRIILEQTLAWTQERAEQDEPFFLGLLTLTAHHPYDVPADAVRLGLEPVQEDLGAYYDAVRYTDDFVRELFAGFERQKLLGSTVFIIVGDHGEAFGEHGMTTHGNILWDEALEVPALVYAPSLISEGRRIAGPHLLTDVMPTVAEMLNMQWEGPQPPGYSLLRHAPPERTLVHAMKEGRAALALRRDSKKYLFEYHRRPTQVYDLLADPAERRDVAAHAVPGEIQSAERELLTWIKDVRHAYWLAREEAGVEGEDALPSGRRHFDKPNAGP